MEQIQEESLMFSQSPLCPIAADVISDGESIYFYLYDLDFESERLIAKTACWVKNLVEAPKAFEKDKIADNKQPLLPEMFCAAEMDLTPWSAEDLEIVWSKEGHIAGLFYQGNVVSILPSWADGNTFPGYARYASENNMVAWKMCDAIDVMLPRLLEGRGFWNQEFNLVWKEYNTTYFAELTAMFGEAKNCFDLHKDTFPSRLLLTFEKEDMTYAFTIGMGMFSMPNADRYFDNYESYAQTEFAISYKSGSLSLEEEMDVYAGIAGLCNVPWHTMDCIASGHTVDMKFQNYEHCMIIDDDMFTHPLALTIKEQDVHINWIKPMSNQEFEDAHDKDKKEALITQLCQA